MNKKYLTILIHLSGWIAFFIFPFVLINFPTSNHVMEFNGMKPPNQQPALFPFFIINNLLFILFFYINLYYLLPQLYYKKKKVTYFITMFVLLLVAVYLPSYIKTQLVPDPQFFDKNFPRHPGNDKDRIFGFLHFLTMWLLSTIISLSQRYRRMERRNKEIKEQKLSAELSYLKAQVNPHFLFNTLNNIYALSICQSEQTPEAILKLSSIMRYVTQDAEAEKVPLEKELDYLNNYIALQQLRSNKHLAVSFDVTGDYSYQVIAPLLLINFIENAFKHGVSNHVSCFVHIKIHVSENQLHMEVVNKKMELIKMESTSIGADNTRRRLQFQYRDKHRLSVEEKDEMYKVTLQLNLA
jgi:two-component system, LytTR family, sensor kinase